MSSSIARCTRAAQHNFFDKLIPVPASRVGAGTIIWGMGRSEAEGWGMGHGAYLTKLENRYIA